MLDENREREIEAAIDQYFASWLDPELLDADKDAWRVIDIGSGGMHTDAENLCASNHFLRKRTEARRRSQEGVQGKTGTFGGAGLFSAVGSYNKENDICAVEFIWNDVSRFIDLGVARTLANMLLHACEDAEKLKAETRDSAKPT
jgi:hypothetical protein